MSNLKRYDVRCGANQDDDRQVTELEGQVELGMQQDALRTARQLLKRKKIRARVFNASMNAILIHADKLKSWKSLMENAYARLSKRDRPRVRYNMLAFYNAIHDWPSAYHFLPSQSRTALDLLFAMETLLNLRKTDEANSFKRRCWRRLRQTTDPDDTSALLEALASYYAQIGELGTAEELWIKSTNLELFSPQAMTGLSGIEAVRGMLYVVAGFLQIEQFRKQGEDANAITLPHNRDTVLDQIERRLKKYQEALERIVPAEELWHFGWQKE